MSGTTQSTSHTSSHLILPPLLLSLPTSSDRQGTVSASHLPKQRLKSSVEVGFEPRVICALILLRVNIFCCTSEQIHPPKFPLQTFVLRHAGLFKARAPALPRSSPPSRLESGAQGQGVGFVLVPRFRRSSGSRCGI